MKNNSVIVAGIEITDEKFPHLYKIAQTNKEGLEEQIISLDRAQGGEGNLNMTAILLEKDLAHG